MATRAISALSTSYATLQAGDTIAVDRGGVTGKTTYAQLVSELGGEPGLFNVITFEQFGALGDGTTDDSDAIQDAIDAAAAAGGGIVTGKSEVYKVDTTRVADAAGRIANLVMKQNVHMRGPFKLIRGTTVGSRAVVWIAECTAGSIRDVEIDANDAAISATTVHGIFKNRNLENYLISNVIIRNTSAYGIGLQDQDTVGPNAYTRKCIFENIWLYTIGNDGIDVKDNSNSTGQNIFRNIFVDGWGTDAASSSCGGVQVRGFDTLVDGVDVRNPGPAALRGVACQTVDNASPPGQNRLVNINVDMSGFSSASAVGITIDTSESEIVGATVVSPTGGIGVLVSGNATNVGITAVNVVGNATATGFLTGDADNTNIRLNGCSAIGNDVNYNLRGPDTHMTGCRSGGSDNIGIRIDSAATDCSVTGGHVTISSGSRVSDLAGDCRFNGVKGIVTEAAGTATVAVDAITTVSGSISHGLAFTPAVQDISLTVAGATHNDFNLGWIRVVSTTSTVVNYAVKVTTASSTGGATMTLGLRAAVRR
jgi:hypothetical protein